MAKGIVDLVDRDYSLVRRDARFGIKPLRTRPSSFTFMSNLWSNWRKEYLKRKLEKQKEALLQEQFEANVNGALSDSSLKKMEEKTEAIAELEQRIKFLSKKIVPRNFVASHAIKLRRNMFDHLTFNGKNAYSVGLDKYDKVFESNQESEVAPETDTFIPSSVEDAMASIDSGIPVANEFVPEPVEETGVVADAPESVEESEVVEVAPEPVEESEVVEVAPEPVEESEVATDAPAQIGREEIDSSISDEIDAIESNVQSISPQDVEIAIKGENRFENDSQELDDRINREEIASSIEASLNEISAIPEVDEQDSSHDNVPDVIIPADSHEISDDIGVESKAIIPTVNPEVEQEAEYSVDDNSDIPDNVEDDITDIISVPATDSTDYSNIDAGLDNISVEVSNPSEEEVVHDLQDDIASIASSDDDSVENIRVSKNGSSAAKVDHYDDEGEQTYREWVPLSDEEIEAAQRDLAEHPVTGTVSNDSFEIPVEDTPEVVTEDPIRDFVVVAPDREVHSVDELVNNPSVEDVSANNDVSAPVVDGEEASEDLGVEQVMNSFARATTLEEFMSVKEAVERLQRMQQETNHEREEAERRAEEREKQARESERLSQEKMAVLEQKMALLQEYSQALKEDCNYNENKMRSALSSVEESERIIAEQENSVREADDVIAAIDSLIGPQAVNVTVKGR